MPPAREQGRFLQSVRFVMNPLHSSLANRRELGDVWRAELLTRTEPARGTIEHRLRQTIRRLLLASTHPAYALIELQNAGSAEPRGILKMLLGVLDRQLYAVIRERRAAGPSSDRNDVLSLLLEARDEEGQ